MVEFLIAISQEKPRYGWRRAAKAARRRGWALNDKRVKGLWKVHGGRSAYLRFDIHSQWGPDRSVVAQLAA